MWILDKRGSALNTNGVLRVYWELLCDNTFLVSAKTADEYIALTQFNTREDAKAYIADLVHKLNGDMSQQEFRAITSLNDLVHIRDELNIIFDYLYPPLNRDKALSHTKELIDYVHSLIAEIEGDNRND